MEPTKEGLRERFEQKKLTRLVSELDTGKTTYEEYFARTEKQWEIYGDAGNDIYNYLHQNDGIGINF